jgi:hypothetical protein
VVVPIQYSKQRRPGCLGHMQEYNVHVVLLVLFQANLPNDEGRESRVEC